MQIIEGFDLYHKLDTLAKEIANTSTPTVIITEHPEYVEDIFLHHTDVLFNIEIKSLMNYERDLLVRKHIFNTKIYNTPTLVYNIRHILLTNTFQFFKLSTNPYSLIDEIIKALKLLHENKIPYEDVDNDLTAEKLAELKAIDCLLDLDDTFYSLDEVVLNLIDESINENIYVIGDDYVSLSQRALFTKLDQYTNVTMLLSCDDEERLECVLHHFYEGTYINYHTDQDIIAKHLFDIVPVNKIGKAHVIRGGNYRQEVLKVTADIKEKIVKEKAHFSDFMVITKDDLYQDYLKTIFDQWHYSHTIEETTLFYYDSSFIKIKNALPALTAQAFHDITKELLQLDLSNDYKDLLVQFNSDDPITPDEFFYFLVHILSSHQASEPIHDAIIVTDFKHALSASPKHIYILGLNEGSVPEIISDEGILLEEDFNTMTVRPLSLIERQGLIYMQIIRTLHNPLRSLTLSYSNADMDGKEVMKSTLMTRLEDLYELTEPSINMMIHHEQLYLRGSRLPDHPINEAIDDYIASKNNAKIIDEVYRDRLGKGMSVSRMETYNKCPFQYYLKYGLRIYPRIDDSLKPTELGSLAHYIMEKCLDDPEHVHEHAFDYIHDHLEKKYQANMINKFFIDHLVEDMKVNVRVVRNQLDHDAFTVTGYEQPIQGLFGDIPVGGIIDRVDCFEHYMRIIDYKSGDKDLNLDFAAQGFNIQMLVYLDLLKKETKLDPGAILYYSMKRRILTHAIDKKYTLHSAFDLDKYHAQFTMKGYVIDDEKYTVTNACDIASIPVNLKKDGTPDKHSHIISQEKLDFIMKLITDYITELYEKLRAGNIPILPTKSDNNNPSIYPCTFCDYKSVCLFDVFYNENRLIKSKYLSTLKEEEANEQL